jgi:hypothetical protein
MPLAPEDSVEMTRLALALGMATGEYNTGGPIESMVKTTLDLVNHMRNNRDELSDVEKKEYFALVGNMWYTLIQLKEKPVN